MILNMAKVHKPFVKKETSDVLKLDSLLSKKVYCFDESDAFSFILKVALVLKVFKFLS